MEGFVKEKWESILDKIRSTTLSKADLLESLALSVALILSLYTFAYLGLMIFTPPPQPQCSIEFDQNFKAEEWFGVYKHKVDVEHDFDIYHKDDLMIFASGMHKDEAIFVKADTKEYWKCDNMSFSLGVWTAKTQSFGHYLDVTGQCEFLDETSRPFLPNTDVQHERIVHVNIQTN